MARQSRPAPNPKAGPVAVLITRPEPQASRFAADLAARLGDRVRPVVSPLMRLEWLAPDLPPAAGVVFTSETAVAATAARRALLPDPAWCVGPRTAEAARKAGFRIMATAATGADLARTLSQSPPPGHLLWLRGEEVAGGLTAGLAGTPVHLDQAMVYRQAALPPTDTARALLDGAAPLVVLLFSPRSADLFAQAAATARAPLHLCAISPAALAPTAGLPALTRDTAARPDGPAMLDLAESRVCALLPT